MILRPAGAGDAAAIRAIANAVIRDTLVTFTTAERTEAGIAGEIAARAPAYLVAELDRQVVGFATYGAFRSGPGYAFTREHTIQLAPAARGRGIGRALMARLEAVAAEAGVHVLVAGVSAANPGGIAFHAAIGYSEVGRMPQVGYKAGRWLDLVLMQKIIPPGGETGPDSGAGRR